MSKFSKTRPVNTELAKFRRQPSISKVHNNIDQLILASKLSSVNSASVGSDIALDVEQVYNCEVELTDQRNEIEGKKELDTIAQFIEPEPIAIEQQPKRTMHFADVVLKIRNQGFLERIKRLKELRDSEQTL